MRALKILLIILVALGALLVILSLVGPSNTTVERSVTIAAPDSVVYPKIASLKTLHSWDSWALMERDQVVEFTGTDGEVGSAQIWSGDTLGKGSMTVRELVPHERVSFDMHFMEPFESKADVTYTLVQDGSGTKVTERLTTNNGFLIRIMYLFMDPDAMMGPMFEQGLDSLKARTEGEYAAVAADIKARTQDGYLINKVERPETVYVGKRAKKLKWSEMEAFFGNAFSAAGAALGAAGLTPASMPSAVYFAWNEAEQTADLLAGFAVKAPADLAVPGMDVHVVPAGRMLHIAYYGHYDKSMAAHVAMEAYLTRSGETHYGNVIEVYTTDPGQEPDTAKWLTDIYYMVR